jgi:hypothetical protein
MNRPLICDTLTNTHFPTLDEAQAIADANNADDGEWEYVAEQFGSVFIVAVYDGGHRYSGTIN